MTDKSSAPTLIALALLVSCLTPADAADTKPKRFTKPVEGPSLDGPILKPGSIIPPDTEIERATPPDNAYGAYQRGYYLTALKLALPRAELGDAAAQTLIAELYRKGLGVGRDQKKAVQWYKFAADAGNRQAQFLYANILLKGEGVEPNKELSEKYMQKAAEAGHLEAQFNLAQLITSKRPTWASFKKALPYYTAAAEGGIPDAQFALAVIHAEAKGVLHNDDEKALSWLKKAANNGYDTAQLELAIWSASGRGAPNRQKDIKASQLWFTRAAAQGNVIAQNRLARIHTFGLGTERDVVKGIAWHILAKRAGLSDSKLDQILLELSDIDKKRAIEGANQLSKRTGS